MSEERTKPSRRLSSRSTEERSGQGKLPGKKREGLPPRAQGKAKAFYGTNFTPLLSLESILGRHHGPTDRLGLGEDRGLHGLVAVPCVVLLAAAAGEELGAEVAPVDFGLTQGGADAEDRAFAIGGDADGDEHGAV